MMLSCAGRHIVLSRLKPSGTFGWITVSSPASNNSKGRYSVPRGAYRVDRSGLRHSQNGADAAKPSPLRVEASPRRDVAAHHDLPTLATGLGD